MSAEEMTVVIESLHDRVLELEADLAHRRERWELQRSRMWKVVRAALVSARKGELGDRTAISQAVQSYVSGALIEQATQVVVEQ